ncbi:MAG: polyprenyl synthetase family protein [Bacteroidota bacterium]
MTLSEIQQPIKSELAEFEKRFRASMKSSVPLLDKIMMYILKQKGKQMRPLFVLLSAKLNNEIKDSTYIAASLIELLHTATLVHDDVVDEADERRGMFSLNAIWKNKISVLTGDYLLSRGLLATLENKEYALLEIVTRAVKEMSEGELLQLEKARNFNATEDVYYEIIRKKTASLIAACCACGVASTGANTEKIDILWKFGELVGLAFQIKDDIFDFQENAKTGKAAGNDIKEQKFTLPLIFALNKSSYLERRKVIRLIKSANTEPSTLVFVRNFVIEKGGINYSQNKMIEFVNEAKLLLMKNFDESEARKYILELVDYTILREK